MTRTKLVLGALAIIGALVYFMAFVLLLAYGGYGG